MTAAEKSLRVREERRSTEEPSLHLTCQWGLMAPPWIQPNDVMNSMFLF